VFVKINGMHVAILLPLASFATVFYGVEGAAWAYVAAGTVVLPVNFIIITRFLHLSGWQFVSSVWATDLQRSRHVPGRAYLRAACPNERHCDRRGCALADHLHSNRSAGLLIRCSGLVVPRRPATGRRKLDSRENPRSRAKSTLGAGGSAGANG
jgi:hypothetical protein